MSISYDGSHSVTFIKGVASSTYSVRRSWEDFHLIPEKSPVVMARTPKTVILDIPFSSNSIDYTNIVNKGTYFEPSNGEWSFYIDHDKWNTWYETKEEIESFINGQALYCVIEDDPDYKYHGRFEVSNWEDGNDYSKIEISYTIDDYMLENDFVYDSTDFYNDTISDSWEEILESIKNNTYKSKYNIGDIKNVQIKGIYGSMPMQIAAFDKDINSNNYSAPITWISKEALITPSNMYDSGAHSTGSGAWYYSNVYKVINKVYSGLPIILKEQIAAVRKFRFEGYSDVWSDEKIWIPSHIEVFGDTNVESYGHGSIYGGIFTDNNSRIRKIHSQSSKNSSSPWWLRSVGKGAVTTSFEGVSSDGSSSTIICDNVIGVVFGFCT